MRIKHFAGYGLVEAKKISVETKNGVRTLVVKVKGNHEWGINRELDNGCIYAWLVKKFDKTLPDDFNYYRAGLRYKTETGMENGVDTCIYTIQYIVDEPSARMSAYYP